MNEIAVLVKRVFIDDDWDESYREVFCTERSIGMREFYQASGTDFRPELKLVLADYLDYEGETHVDYKGARYRVVRTYRNDIALELTLERAAQTEGVYHG